MIGVLIYFIGFLISFVFCSLIGYRECRSFTVWSWRKDLGFAMTSAFAASLIWPLGIPLTLCFTGFAEHGIWRQK